MTRLTINIHDAKTNLSGYLTKVQNGQIVTICKNGLPIAQLIPYTDNSAQERQIWGLGGKLFGPIEDNFNDPLTDDEFLLTPIIKAKKLSKKKAKS